LTVLAAPQYLGLTGFFSMNALDLAFWAGAALLVARLARLDRPRLWLPLGLLIGLGLMNKLSMLFFALGLGVAALLTPLRRHLRTRWPWLGALLAAACLLPHVLWQVAHGWPTAEFIRNATRYKNAVLTPLQFLGAQVLEMDPLNAPLWLAGLAWLLFARGGRTFRALGVIYAVALGVMLLQGAKPYYLAPAYALLLPAGAVAFAAWQERRRWAWPGFVATALLLAGGAALAPFALPLLPVEGYLAWQRTLGLTPTAAERQALGPLPQFYADRFGWRELAQEVARVRATLPPEDRARVLIVTDNYGEAGALRYFGRELGLPPAVSQHNSFWLWGPGRSEVGVAIIVGKDEQDMRAAWEQVEVAGRFSHPYAMPYEQRRPILVCRGLRFPLAIAWRMGRMYI
jgi:4-amino-4-deoxy-L-arabinose transferase-like glycosyltransferase